MVIGADLDDDRGSNSGSAYVFVRSGSTWTQQMKLTASDGAENDGFGVSVAIYRNVAVIGASGSDSSRGSAYVFTRSDGAWSQHAKLIASSGASNDSFGMSVALVQNIERRHSSAP